MIEFRNVSLDYPGHPGALQHIQLFVAQGEFVYLIGQSGAGKSSFMNLLIKRYLPTRGEILVANVPLSRYKKAATALLRRQIGMVFQDNRLLGHLSAYDNVAFALQVTGVPRREWKGRVQEALGLVGLDLSKAYALPQQLSQGEQQRVAIARALVGRPPLLLADEPTGNLDPANSYDILQVLEDINARGTTVLLATHARELVEHHRHRTLTLRGGKLVRDYAQGGYEL